MATLLLTVGASFIPGPGWLVAAAEAAGGIAGSFIDNGIFGTTTQQQGSRLDSLQVQASTEGAAIPEIAGGVRLAGQIIWATNYKEVASTTSSGGKAASSQTVETTNYTYFGNFAIGICEGVIDRIGQIWADGNPFDQTGVTMRVYTGAADQDPDPLIEGVQGTGQAPAYRGTAYVVFDNLALAAFGNRIPQFTFEVFRRVGDAESMEELVEGLCVIPGAGERVYDTVIQKRFFLLTESIPENNATGTTEADFSVAMDNAVATFTNLNTVLLVVGWFGDDLRCGSCTIRPKVDSAIKLTEPDVWGVHGLDRASAQVTSQFDGRPAYGGTPSDDSVVRAIRDLHSRGMTVVIYPFLFMDVPPGNTLPDPYGGTAQGAYPWRGRITCTPAPGQSGTVDKTSGATSQIAAFFGSAAASDISVSVDAGSSAVSTTYSGPSEWSFRRFILHYAKLAEAINGVAPGAVAGMLIGSEMRGVTQVRDSATNFPGVATLKTLADDVKGVVGSGVKISYAADWSEYNGYKPADASGDFFFNLDPLWSASSVDFVGVDNYTPLSDWREGLSHLDAAAGFTSIYEPAYLQANVEGGEDYDWFYADQSARDSQTRTPITDGAYSKPWVFRAKDFRNWWLNHHFDRPGGVEAGSATGWTPQSKPFWFTEWGIPSVDKGTNQPNVFFDPKSSESLLPYYSKGNRDDLIQRRGHEAFLSYWRDNNPTSTVYGGSMIAKINVWTIDARPYPAFPGRTDLWADGDEWPLGHWIKGGVAGSADLALLVAERCSRVGFTAVDVSDLNGVVMGYVRDQPTSPRSEIELLMTAYGFDAVESEGVVRFVTRGAAPVATFTIDQLLAPTDNAEAAVLTRADELDLPNTITLAFTDPNNDYESGAVSSQRLAGFSARTTNTTFPIVMDQTQAQSIADRSLAEAWVERETGQFGLPPSQIALEACDVVNLVIGTQTRAYKLTQITNSGGLAMQAKRTEAAVYGPVLPGIAPPTLTTPTVYGPAQFRFMNLPLLNDSDVPFAPYVAASATPWAGVTVLDSPTGDAYALDTLLPLQATLGETTTALNAGPLDVWDFGNTLTVQLYSGQLSSRTADAILTGEANALAVQNADGDWEILQFVEADLVGSGVYTLRQLLRGRLGTEGAMRSPLAIGAPVVVLDGSVSQLNAALSERGVARFYSWGPTKVPQTDPAWKQATFTDQAVGLMPWAPCHLKGSRNGAGDLAMTWVRRTRLGGVWTDGVDVPLNEESESYQVDILSGSTVVRTLASGTPAASYSAAEQIADFGSAQSAVSVAVYQLSATVGRGRRASATL